MKQKTLLAAKNAWQEAEAILVGSGAGMGVDSGLPDFRGDSGFWKAYPPLKKLGVQFEEIADPHWFKKNPALAWGFYGHRFNLYRKTKPHEGFKILLEKNCEEKIPMFIFTSNVDGHFQKTGFQENQIMECHGSLMHFQCIEECGQPIWPIGPDLHLQINTDNLLAKEPLPSCPQCGSLARPNILMFSDFAWNSTRTYAQRQRFEKWIDKLNNKKLLIIELGAGTNIPTVRLTCEEVYQSTGNQFIRVNPRESKCELQNTLSLPMGAKDAIKVISQKY
ncbi:MAG: Sir2 family NAD-dependent protein deacetylase [Opitutales bacterium]|nr:Sir2 family NAD-dependent protein deacetylase [Opitutales bacterium]